MCINPLTIKNPTTGEEIEVSCGKCILCRRKKCRNWALRLYHEGQYHKKMCMITLTFRPKFLLRPKYKTLYKTHTKKQKDGKTTIIKEYYETMISPEYITDVKKTGWLLTLFMKKLRKELSKSNRFITYFAVGEHGSQNTHRAHWHVLIFGIDKNDLGAVNIGISKKNKQIFYSPIIDELWSYDKMKIGQHTISDVTTATIKYVANYTMKKMYKNIEKQYPTQMRFSNQGKIGTKWARRFHKELRKGYLEDEDKQKYTVPRGYYNEMIRYVNQISNEPMTQTAIAIEINKDELINRLKKAGLLTQKELQKKAKRLEFRYKNQDRDTI